MGHVQRDEDTGKIIRDEDTGKIQIAVDVPCIFCWGTPGSPFGSFTPNIINVTFADIEKGPNWFGLAKDPSYYNQTFELEQWVLTETFCSWKADHPYASVILLFSEFGTGIRMSCFACPEPGNRPVVFDGGGDECITSMDNDENDVFVNGDCTIDLP